MLTLCAAWINQKFRVELYLASVKIKVSFYGGSRGSCRYEKEVQFGKQNYLNGTSYHGSGAIEEIANEAKAHGFKKAFVCSDPDLIKFKVTAKVTDILDREGLSYEIYSDIKANPTIENVQSGVSAFKKSGADYIVAIGGGSSMDTAKAIGIIIANPNLRM